MRTHVRVEPTTQAALPPSPSKAASAPAADMAHALRFAPRLADIPEQPPERSPVQVRAAGPASFAAQGPGTERHLPHGAPPVVQLAGHPLEAVLGDGNHVGIRTAVAVTGRAAVFPNAYLVGEATALVAAGVPQNDAATLLARLVRSTANQLTFTRARGFAEQMHAGGVPVGTITGILQNYAAAAVHPVNGPRMVALAIAVHHWQWANVHALLTGYGALGGGLQLDQLAVIAGHLPADSDADALAFAATAGYNAAGKAGLTQAFALANPNGLTAANWVALAVRAGANQGARAALFARIPNWGFAAIDQTIQDFANANPAALTAAQWTTLAGHLGANEDAGTAAFAAIAGWTAAQIVALGGFYAAANYGVAPAQWAALAANLPAANPDRARRAAEFVGAGWHPTVAFGGAARPLIPIGDGIMYGDGYPHVTIHGLADGTPRGNWGLPGNRGYHVRRAVGGPNVYDYDGPNRHFFGGVNMANAGWADGIAAQFWAAV